MSLKREAIGFALAPLPIVVPLIFLFGFIWLDRPDDGASILSALLEGIFGSYSAAVLIGLPIHLVLHRLGWCSLLAYLGATALGVAAIVGMMMAISAAMTPTPAINPRGLLSSTGWLNSTGLYAVLIFTALSLVCASVFWCVSVRKRHL
jgi:hypothetical protein